MGEMTSISHQLRKVLQKTLKAFITLYFSSVNYIRLVLRSQPSINAKREMEYKKQVTTTIKPHIIQSNVYIKEHERLLVNGKQRIVP